MATRPTSPSSKSSPSSKALPFDTRGGSVTRLDITVSGDEWEPDRYPRTCRQGHLICGPHDEVGWDKEGLKSHHLQCRRCRAYSQGVAWCRWAFRRWLWSLGFDGDEVGRGGEGRTGADGQAQAQAILEAHEAAWDAYVRNAGDAALRAARRAYSKALRSSGVVAPEDAPAWEPTRYGVIR